MWTLSIQRLSGIEHLEALRTLEALDSQVSRKSRTRTRNLGMGASGGLGVKVASSNLCFFRVSVCTRIRLKK